METDIIKPEIKEANSTDLIKKIRNDFIGLDTKYQIGLEDRITKNLRLQLLQM